MKKEYSLKRVALTINNVCNLNCPHCYLQYESEAPGVMMSSRVRERIYSLNGIEMVIIVGMEPFYNKESVKILEEIAETFSSRDVQVNVITNGLNLNLVTDRLINSLSVIDISLDGGRMSYQGYRKGNLDKIVRNVQSLKTRGYTGQLNCLNVINAETIGYIEDVIEVDKEFCFDKIFFSPYIRTLNDGSNTVEISPMKAILKKLRQCTSFLKNQKCVMFFGVNHVISDVSKEEELVERNEFLSSYIRENFDEDKVVYALESLAQGLLRITYDGIVLDPYHALHPSLYKDFGASIFDTVPEEFYKRCIAMREDEEWSIAGESRVFPIRMLKELLH